MCVTDYKTKSSHLISQDTTVQGWPTRVATRIAYGTLTQAPYIFAISQPWCEISVNFGM